MRNTTTMELSRRILPRLARDLSADEILAELNSDCDLIRMSSLSEQLKLKALEACHEE